MISPFPSSAARNRGDLPDVYNTRKCDVCPLRFTIFGPLRKSTKFYKFLNLLLGAEHNSMMEGAVVRLRKLNLCEAAFFTVLGFTDLDNFIFSHPLATNAQP